MLEGGAQRHRCSPVASPVVRCVTLRVVPALAQILDWLQRRPSAMETYLRPGCVHVSAYLAMPHSDWDAVRGCAERALALASLAAQLEA